MLREPTAFLLLTGLLLIGLVFISCGQQWTYVELNQTELEKIQREVDQGHKVGYLDKENVVFEFLIQHKLKPSPDSHITCDDKEDNSVC